MGPEQRLQALRDFGAEFGHHSERAQQLREHILRLDAEDAEGPDPSPAAVDTVDTGDTGAEAPATA